MRRGTAELRTSNNEARLAFLSPRREPGQGRRLSRESRRHRCAGGDRAGHDGAGAGDASATRPTASTTISLFSERNGLVVARRPGTRSTGARRFDVAGGPVALRYRLDDRRAARRRRRRWWATMTRSAERGVFRRAFRARARRTAKGPHRNLRAGRRTAWLTDAELANAEPAHRTDPCAVRPRSSAASGARLHEFTYVLAPMVAERPPCTRNPADQEASMHRVALAARHRGRRAGSSTREPAFVLQPSTAAPVRYRSNWSLAT